MVRCAGECNHGPLTGRGCHLQQAEERQDLDATPVRRAQTKQMPTRRTADGDLEGFVRPAAAGDTAIAEEQA
ncbi:hypothetical protein NDU88_005312 [Pleurodeles waltl]|uniref:Uncharacterized protein n=1 Tax=Pleurodeles waltl TaxID=8319 RepID=A0AAV7MVW7_PLEWA|nr:hypothetical protein NDU88_005312 [Pleurodeles waltl]